MMPAPDLGPRAGYPSSFVLPDPFPLTGRSILVVEDNGDLAALLAALFEGRGATVQVAANGEAALDAMRQAPPHLVLLDIQMDPLDGWETLRRLRGDDDTAAVPVIVCTARGGRNDFIMAYELGCDGFVRKPFDQADLFRTVDDALGRDAESRVAFRAEQLARLGHPGN